MCKRPPKQALPEVLLVRVRIFGTQENDPTAATFESTQVRGKLATDVPFVSELENEQVQANLVSEMQKAEGGLSCMSVLLG